MRNAPHVLPIFFVLLSLVSSPATAAERFVAPDGDDANDGSRQAPFATIQKGVDSLQPGDTCFVMAGRYRETVTIPRGGRQGAPIRLVAWPGDVVVLDGTEPVEGPWRRHDDSIWAVGLAEPVEQLFAGDRMMLEARWPNTSFKNLLTREGWAPVDADSRYGRIHDTDLAETGVDWTGATAVLNIAHQFFTWARPVKNHAPGKVWFEYEKDMGQQLDIQSKWTAMWTDDFYYLTGKLEAIDAPGEWFHDADAGVLYFQPPDGVDPATLDVRRKARDYALEADGVDFVEVSGFHFFGAAFQFNDCDDCVVERCHLRFPVYDRGVPEMEKPRRPRARVGLRGHRNVLRDCSLAHSATDGFKVAGGENLVDNVLVRDLNWSGTIHYQAVSLGPFNKEGRASVARRVTAHHFGNVAMSVGGLAEGVVELSHVHHGGLLSNDVSLIYTQLPIIAGTEFRYNWVHDSLSPNNSLGLRGDDQTRGLHVHHNVVWNCGRHAIVVKGDNNRVYNNTCFANGETDLLLFAGPEPEKVWRNQYPLLPEQNVHSLAINNALRIVKGHNRGPWADKIPGDYTNNYLGEHFRMVDPANLDFRPRPDSPLVDAGRAVDGVTADFVGEAPDIGAYEYGGPHWLPGHRNGLWIGRDGAALRVALTMPVEQGREVRVVAPARDGAFEPVTLVFQPDDWARPRAVAAAGRDALRFDAADWGTVDIALADVDARHGARVEFPRPDLTSADPPIERKFDYDQVQHMATATARPLRAGGRAYWVQNPPAIDGRVANGEWPGAGHERFLQIQRFRADAAAAVAGSAYALTDGNALYMLVAMASDNPAAIDTTRSEWGPDGDGMEIDLQAFANGQLGPVFILHGFPSGAHESATDAGATEEQAARLEGATRFAASITPQGWIGEWAIPLDALGADPAAIKRLRFNVGGHIGTKEDGAWAGWVPDVTLYDVEKGGDLRIRPVVPAAAPNLIQNGGFEAGDLRGWTQGNNQGRNIPGHKVLRVNEGLGGDWCVRLSADDPDLMRETISKWIQAIAGRVEPGRSYVLSYEMRAAELTPRAKDGKFCSYIHVRKDGKPGGNVGQQEYAVTDKNVPWTRRELVLEMPENAEPSMLTLQLHRATGSIWLDNIALYPALGE